MCYKRNKCNYPLKITIYLNTRKKYTKITIIYTKLIMFNKKVKEIWDQ